MFETKIAILTGASRGLRRALAAGLAAAGWRLVLDARGASDLQVTAGALGDRVVAVPGDVTVAAHRAELVAAADGLGGASLLINNAGILGPSPQPPLPIRYRHVPRPWPLRYYQTVFATQPGRAEMPSAGRPFTDRLVTRLVSTGVLVVPILLHTGVASPEAHERPYPEWFSVPPSTAHTVTRARAEGGRVLSVGTTVVRALESAVRADATIEAASGWTDLVVTPQRGVRAVDGLLTGLHEPCASHLDLLAAVAGRPLLERCYQEAVVHGYLWHEFGDLNLLLP